MTAENENENEPVKLTEKLRSEITEEEPIEEKVELTGPVVPEDEERFEETVGTTECRPKHRTSKAREKE